MIHRTFFRLTFVFGVVGMLTLAPIVKAASDGESDSENTESMMQGDEPKLGLLMPAMNPAHGRKLFASKGCVVCHAINGIGGEDAPPLDAGTMPRYMNPFEFTAKMWRGAETMIYMQQEELGEQIEFDGDELADIISFVHNAREQAKFSEDDIPDRIKELMAHLSEEEEGDSKDENANEAGDTQD